MKATYVRPQNVWKIFWMRAGLKWHGYKTDATVVTIEDFLKVVDSGEYGCFWG